MSPAKDLYIALRDDPNLEVPEGDSRESAAWKETAQRTRQHHTNAKALGMASEVKEDSAVEKFSDFLNKAKRKDARAGEEDLPAGVYLQGGNKVNDDGSLYLEGKEPEDGVRVHDLGFFHPDELETDEEGNRKIKPELLSTIKNDRVVIPEREGYRKEEVRTTGQAETIKETSIPKGVKSHKASFDVPDKDREPGGKDSPYEAPPKAEEPKAKGITPKSIGPFASDAAFRKSFTHAFKSEGITQASLNRILKDLSRREKTNLAHNIHEYLNTVGDDETKDHDLHTEMSDWSSSLPEDEKAGLIKHLASSRKPFTANSSIDVEELKSNGYIGTASAKGGHKLTVQGAAHLISGNMKTSGKNPFTISEKKFAGNKKDISDPESWGAIAPDKFVPDKTTKEKQNQLAKDLTNDGIFENEKTANKVIAGTTDDDTNFVDHEEKLTDYHDKLGGHPIKSSGSKGHIDNLNNDTTTPVRGHVPKGADTPTEEAPKEESKPAEAFKARIHDRNLEAEDVELQPNGKYKLTDEAKEDFGYSEKVGDSDIPRNPIKDPDQKEYLDNLEFSSGDNISGNVGSKVKRAAAPAATPTPAATKPAATKPAEDPSFKERLVAHAKELHESMSGKDGYSPEDPDALSDQQLDAKRDFQDIGKHIISGDDDALLSAMSKHFQNHPRAARAIASKNPNFKEFSANLQQGKYDAPVAGKTEPVTPVSGKEEPATAPVSDQPEVTDPVSKDGRIMTTVELEDGTVQPFYRRTGTGGADRAAEAGQWVPFDGIHKGGNGQAQGWFDKHAYTRDGNGDALDNKDPLKGYGTQEHKDIGKRLDDAFDEGNLFDNQADIIEHETKTREDGSEYQSSSVKGKDYSKSSDEPLKGAKELNQHLADQGSPHAEQKIDRWEGTDHRFGLPEDYVPPTQVEDVGTGDKGVDATDSKDAASAASGKEFDDLMATDHGKQVLAHTYEETHGKNNPFTSEEDHKESLRADYIKNPTKAKNEFSKKWNASEKVKVTAEKAKETAATKVENKAKKDGVTELHQKLKEAGHKGSKADAAALHDTHNGDIDAALDQKNKDKKEQEAKVESANTLPDGLSTPDEIKQELFGDTNPSGALAGNLPERSSNKHGVKATQMARELLIHAQTHKDTMSNETKKSITEQLSILANPENSIKGFKANKGEKFADLDHAVKQIADLEDRGIDLNSPEATQELQSKDLTLQEHRENFKAKHLDGISDSTEAPEVRAAKTVGKVAGKVAGAVKRGDTEGKEHKSESHARIWDHGTPNHTESFDEEGNSKGRSKFDHSKGESVKGWSDSIHHSPVKEHHGTLTAKQEESMSKLRQAHRDNDPNIGGKTRDTEAEIDKHRKDLEDSGLSRSDFEHGEDDIPTSGPPDKEVAIYMQGQGYEWHEDTRRWRHKETDDNYRKSNGATKGTFASGSHSETGAHGYMATAEMGADGKVTATPDTGNYAITPAGTHGVSSDLGGSPPTSAQGIQGHVLGHALNNAGVSHDGKSKSFPMSHLNGTGIHDSKHYDKPAGMKASAKRGAGAAYRAATGGGVKAYMDRTKKNWSSPLVSSSSPLSQTLGRAGKIGAGLVRDVFGKSDISELTPVELLQFHVALQKAEEKTNLRV